MREGKCALKGERFAGVIVIVQGLRSAIIVPQTRNFVDFVFFPSLKCINTL